MPNCSTCGRHVPTKEDLTLARTERGRWAVLCPACLEVQAKRRESETEPSDAPPPPQIMPEMPANWTPAERLQVALETLQQEILPEDASYARAHVREYERHEADLPVRFRLARDSEELEGRVLDLSQGGMRFTTHRELAPGHVLDLEVETPAREEDEAGEQANAGPLKTAGEVRRVRDLQDGRFEVGVRFVRRMRTNAPNRRKHPRRRTDLDAFYRRSESMLTYHGRAIDISAGGVRLLVDEELPEEAILHLRLRGEQGPFRKADLVGTVRVVRVEQKRRDAYEAGCRFAKMGMQPRTRTAEDNAT